MKLLRFAPVLLLAASISPAFSQQKVPLRNMHERLLLVVPMIGAGTTEDPRRPMFVPAPTPNEPPSPDGIIAFTFQESDDGRYALVEVVARDRATFKAIFDAQSSRGDVKVFQKGRDKKEDIEKEFRKHKKDFDLDKLQVGTL